MSSSSTPEELAADILEVLTEEDEKGQPLYPRGDVVDILGLLMLVTQSDATKLPPALIQAVAEFSLKIGAVPSDTRGLIRTKLEEYFMDFPPNPDIMKRIQTILLDGYEGGIDMTVMPDSVRKNLIRG